MTCLRVDEVEAEKGGKEAAADEETRTRESGNEAFVGRGGRGRGVTEGWRVKPQHRRTLLASYKCVD